MRIYIHGRLAALFLFLLASGFIYESSPFIRSFQFESNNNTRINLENSSVNSICKDSNNIYASEQFPGRSTNYTAKFAGSTSFDKELNVRWNEIGNEVIIQIQNINPNIEMYYGDVTLESGSRIAVKLGKPNKEGKFWIKNTFGKFNDISIYTDLDLELGN